jgi:hypothetical protein
MGTPGTARRRVLARRERGLAELAGRQHGVLSRKQILGFGLGTRTIRRRVEAGRLHPVHREVYALGRSTLDQRGEWMAAVLACGDGALLSHRSAAALWGLIRWRTPEVLALQGRKRPGIAVHECGVHREEQTVIDGIPVTTVARTLLDVAEVADEHLLVRSFEEADRLDLLEMSALEEVYARGRGRHGLKSLRRLMDDARPPHTNSPLEDRVVGLCRRFGLPTPQTNVNVLGREVDVFWPEQKLMVEADSYEFHRHRAAFERDRARDAAMQAVGYVVIRLTHRRLTSEPAKVAAQLRHLLWRGRAVP